MIYESICKMYIQDAYFMQDKGYYIHLQDAYFHIKLIRDMNIAQTTCINWDLHKLCHCVKAMKVAVDNIKSTGVHHTCILYKITKINKNFRTMNM